ncbi:MAG: hypothetical protein RL757_2515 [Bacteroidota bacterium]|jgi:hypothetical protein
MNIYHQIDDTKVNNFKKDIFANIAKDKYFFI